MFDDRKRYPGQPLAVSGSSTGSFFFKKEASSSSSSSPPVEAFEGGDITLSKLLFERKPWKCLSLYRP
jgi:hypothetical protein